MALDISRIPPKGSRGYQYFRANITSAERAELDAYEAEMAATPKKETTSTPAINISEAYNNWFSSTEEGQRSNVATTPDILSSLGMTPEEFAAAEAKRDRDNAALLASISPEQRERLEAMDLSGLSGGFLSGVASGGIFGNSGSVANPNVNVGTFARENQYKNVTQYNPVGTAPEDMVVYDDLNSPEAKAAKAAREKEVAGLLQEWTQPLKELAANNPEQFEQEYNQLPTDARLVYLRNEYDQGSLTEREYQDAFAEQWNNSEKREIGVLQFIEKYGYRMNSPDAIAQQGGQDQQGARDWYEADRVFGGGKGEGGDYSYLGSFTPTVKETFDPTSIGRALEASGPFRAAIAVMTGGISEGVISAVKGLTGDTLHASDWFSIVMAGMQLMPESMGGLSEAEAMEAANEAVYAAADAAEAAGTAFTMVEADAVYSAAFSQARGLEILGMNLGDIQDLVIGEGGQPPSQSSPLIKDAVQSVEDIAAGVGDGIIVNLQDAVQDALASGSDLNTVLSTINEVVTEIQFM